MEHDAETHLFRIAQEALSNIHKHAKASHVEVRLHRCDDTIVLTIEDDGQGFNPSARSAIDEERGMGLVGMRERATLVRGTLRIDTTPGQGTTVVVSIPSG